MGGDSLPAFYITAHFSLLPQLLLAPARSSEQSQQKKRHFHSGTQAVELNAPGLLPPPPPAF